jgi:TetR/AcrR family transcriptional repressor of nem operon
MGYSQAQKAEHREQLLANASQRIRAGGFESISVAALMKTAGLTHGGFYGHFKSRDALLVEALQRALIDGEASARRSAPTAKRGFADIVRGYLSKRHRKSPESGCAIATLVTDVARADANTRRLMEKHINAFIDKMANTMSDDRQRARLAVSAMVGAVMLSRVMTNEREADALIADVRDALLELPHDAD